MNKVKLLSTEINEISEQIKSGQKEIEDYKNIIENVQNNINCAEERIKKSRYLRMVLGKQLNEELYSNGLDPINIS